MMQRIQKVIPMPYNEEKLMNLMENDFPEVKKSIEDFFESDYWKTKLTDFLTFMHKEGKELGYTSEALAEAQDEVIKSIKNAIYLDVFCSALNVILSKKNISWYSMQDEMMIIADSTSINVLFELTIKEIRDYLKEYLESLFKENIVTANGTLLS